MPSELVIVVLLVLFVLCVYGFMVFNNLVLLKHNVAKAWANVDVLLKQRQEELPKLVAICRRYMLHEQDLLGRIAAAHRAFAAGASLENARALGPVEQALRADLSELRALAEGYPDLKANETFLHLELRIAELEAGIADRREFFNATVTANNVGVSRFPTSLLARSCGLGVFHWFAFDDARRPPRSPMGGSR